MSVNRTVKRIFGLKTGSTAGGQIKKNEMDRVGSMHGEIRNLYR
jgi:hypothetical protein